MTLGSLENTHAKVSMAFLNTPGVQNLEKTAVKYLAPVLAKNMPQNRAAYTEEY